MTNTPLNPDALAHAKDAGVDCRINGGSTEDVAECAIEAYLAVAQSEANSVEDLDALPDGSIVKDSEGEVYIMTPYDEFWRVWGNDKRFSSGEIVLPATVLHRP